MQGYPTYKDSEVEWIGAIPSSWDIRPLFTVASESKISNKGMIENNLLSLSYGRIIRKDIETLGGLLPESFETYQVVNENDIIFRLTDLQNDKRSLRSAICGERGIITSAYVAVTPKKIRPKFVHYLMRSYDETKVFYNLGSGMRQSLKYDELRRLPLVTPPESDQEQIEEFLDRETARIDNLIAEKQTFIKLLKEKRQALISHAFRADNKHHRAKLGYFVDLLPGYAFKSELFSESSSDIRLLRGANVGVGSLKWDDVVYWSLDNQIDVEAFALKEGDIVFGMDRPWINAGARAAIVRQEDLPCYLVQRVARIRAKPNVNQKYIYFALASEEFKVHAEADLTGLSVPHISPDQIKSFPIPVLTQEEQDLMVSIIERNTSRIDSIVEEAEQSITLAMEHRTALISSAVTGKIDVRK